MSSSEDEPTATVPKEHTSTIQTQERQHALLQTPDDLQTMRLLTEAATATEEVTPGRRKLKSWLNKMLRIKMTDGRVLIGEFNCTDRDANVIMSMTSECSADDDSEERLIGLAMVPGKHIVSIDIDHGYVWDDWRTKQLEIEEDEGKGKEPANPTAEPPPVSSN